MQDPKNVVILTGGLVDVPEISGNNDSVVRLRLAMDFAGNEQNSDNKSGYFDVKYFLNSNNPNSTFVKNQIDNGNFKKGSTLQLLGRLVQERWEQDGQKRSKVVVYADSITYGATIRKDADGGSGSDGGGAAAAPANDSVPTSF